MALCSLLAFWTGGDAEQMDCLFRESGLVRPKWDEQHFADGATYGERTIERAIAGTDKFYTGSSDTRERTGSSLPGDHGSSSPARPSEASESTSESATVSVEVVEELESELQRLQADRADLQAELEAERAARAELEAELERYEEEVSASGWFAKWLPWSG